MVGAVSDGSRANDGARTLLASRQLGEVAYNAPWPQAAGAAYGVALNADASVIVSGGIDGMVRVWQAHSGVCLATLQSHVGAVWGVALSGNGRVLASGGQDGTLRLWDPTSGVCLSTVHANSGAVYCVAFSKDGRLLASGGLDGTVRLWKPGGDQCLRVMQANAGVIRGVALNHDGSLLASVAANRSQFYENLRNPSSARTDLAPTFRRASTTNSGS